MWLLVHEDLLKAVCHFLRHPFLPVSGQTQLSRTSAPLQVSSGCTQGATDLCHQWQSTAAERRFMLQFCASMGKKATHRVPIFCPLFQAVPKVVPVSKAVVYVAHTVILLELVYWSCTQFGAISAGAYRACKQVAHKCSHAKAKQKSLTITEPQCVKAWHA